MKLPDRLSMNYKEIIERVMELSFFDDKTTYNYVMSSAQKLKTCLVEGDPHIEQKIESALRCIFIVGFAHGWNEVLDRISPPGSDYLVMPEELFREALRESNHLAVLEAEGRDDKETAQRLDAIYSEIWQQPIKGEL